MGGDVPDFAGDVFGGALGGDEAHALRFFAGEFFVSVGDALVKF